jgi:hypothetical protein
MPTTPAIVLLLCVLFGASALGSDRITATAPPEGQETAKQLVESLASACNAGDFAAFMDHFTPSHRSRIRRRMEDAFISQQPKMDIRQVTLLSESEEKICFGVKYAWHDKEKPEIVLASKITARRVNGLWKLDDETVKSQTHTATESNYASSGAAVAPAAWDPFNPPARLISPELEHLRGDIGIQPGRGCANGRCGVR